MDSEQESLPLGVVLVHGMWGSPEDWTWVRRALEFLPGLEVYIPDLPSHRSPSAGLLDDVEEVRSAIAACKTPAVVAGWSYGCDVAGVAVHGMQQVGRLVYASSVPQRLHTEPRDVTWVDGMEHMLWDEYGRFALDTYWWLTADEAGSRLPADVRTYLAENPRRFVTTRTLSDPIQATGWAEIPTTIVLGVDDNLTSPEQRAWARESVADVRDIDTDHFILFNRPDELAGVILKG